MIDYREYDLRSENCSSDKIRVESIQLVNLKGVFDFT